MRTRTANGTIARGRSAAEMLRAAPVLLVLALVAFLPGLLSSEWRGTEARRVQIATEMLQRSEEEGVRAWLVPTLGWERTLAKPPLFYWVEAAVLGLGGGRFSLRLTSVLGLWLVACVAWSVLARLRDRSAAWWGAAAILCSPVLLHDGPFAEIDPVFAGLSASSLLLVAAGVETRRRAPMIAAGAVGALGMLAKGPPYFLFLAGALIPWWRSVRLRGLVPFALLLLGPFAAYYAALSGFVEAEKVGDVAGRESVGRLFTYEWRHVLDIPPYLLRAAAVALPFAAWLLPAVGGRPRGSLERTLVWAGYGGAALLVLFPGRSTRYLLPMVPLAIAAAAPAVARFAGDPRPLPPRVLRLLAALGMLGAAALLAAPFLPRPFPGRSVGLALALGLLPALVGSRRHLVIALLVLPVVASWTIMWDREQFRAHSTRAFEPAAAVLQEELEERGIEPGELATWGHMQSTVLLGLGVIPPGDEFMREPPEVRWLLREVADRQPRERPEGYRDRVRIRTHDRTFVLQERQ